MIHMIQTDPNYSGAAAGEEVVGLGAAWNLFQLMTGGSAHMAEHLTSAEEIDHQIRAVARSAMQSEHPVDVIWEFDASRDYDPAPDLGRIKARLLAVNFADDMINPVELGGLACAIPQVANGRALTLPATPASRGHQTLRTSSAWAEHLQDLMRESEPR